MSIERQEVKREDKRVRVPFGGPQMNLQLSEADRRVFEERGMVPRWFNDQHGRIERATAGGYSYVEPKQVPSLGANLDVGSKVKKVVSKGEPVIYAYLMEISKEFWDEDQALKESRNAQVDEALASGGAGGADVENKYGSGVTYSRN
jgi:hypothetical protein